MLRTSVGRGQRFQMHLAAVLLLSVFCPLSSVLSDDSKLSQQVGTITGRLAFEGVIPERRTLIERGAPVKDGKVCAADASIPDESLLIDKESRGIANAIIWMRRKPAGLMLEPAPELAKDDEPRYVNCRIVPHVSIFRTGQEINVRGGKVLHNPHAFTIRNHHF